MSFFDDAGRDKPAQLARSWTENHGAKYPSPNPITWMSTLYTRIADLDRVSASSDSDQVSVARARLDAEMDDLRHVMRELATRRNNLSPMSRLPAELLSKIFDFLVLDASVHYFAKNCVKSFDWIQVTHVCRHWRQVALNHTSFWGNIICTIPSWTPEFIARSKQAPIRIIHRSDDTRWRSRQIDSLILALSHTHRAKEIYLAGKASLLPRLISHLSCPAPLLESFEAVASPDFTGLTDMLRITRAAEIVYFPLSLFAGEAPLLRRLHLNRCGLDWDSPLYNNLVNLAVEMPISNSYMEIPPSRAQILASLQRMPNIESLELKSAIPKARDDSASDPLVKLPFLRRLTVSSISSSCTWLLQHIAIPPTAHIEVCCQCYSRSNEDFAMPLPYIAPFTGGPEPLRSMWIDIYNLDTIDVKGWPSLFNDPREMNDTDVEPSTNLSFTWHQCDVDTYERMLRIVVEALHTADIRMLYLRIMTRSGINVANPQEWLSLFSVFPSVQSLCLERNAAFPFARAMAMDALGKRDPHSLHESEKEMLLMPDLRNFTLYSVDFFRHVLPEGEYPRAMLFPSLAARIKRNDRLRRIHVVRSALHPEWVESLKTLVPVVIWDGVVDAGVEDGDEEDGWTDRDDFDIHDDTYAYLRDLADDTLSA